MSKSTIVNLTTGEVIITECELTAEELYSQQLALYKKELRSIFDWFESTDYIPNKIIRGDWEETDQRWIDYKQEYKTKHSRKEELEELLSTL